MLLSLSSSAHTQLTPPPQRAHTPSDGNPLSTPLASLLHHLFLVHLHTPPSPRLAAPHPPSATRSAARRRLACPRARRGAPGSCRRAGQRPRSAGFQSTSPAGREGDGRAARGKGEGRDRQDGRGGTGAPVGGRLCRGREEVSWNKGGGEEEHG